MLRGWLPPLWTALGSLTAILRFSLISYWIDSYWGGAVSAPAAFAMLAWLVRLKGRLRRIAVLGAAAPVLCLLVLSARLLACCEAKVAGRPFRLLYEVK